MPAASPAVPPFFPGQYMTNQEATSASTNPTGLQYEGMEFWFEDVDWAAAGPVKPLRSPLKRKLRIVRNCMQCPALPYRLVCTAEDRVINTAGAVTAGSNDGSRYRVAGGGYTHTRVTGYARHGYVSGTADVGTIHPYPVDEFLPAAGAPDGSLFYVVVEGPAIVTTQISDGAAGDIALGDILWGASTVTTAGATTSSSTNVGRVSFAQRLAAVSIGITGSAATTAYAMDVALYSAWGIALSACSTNSTSAKVLVKVLPRRF